jgi:hypothetical protein
MEQDASAKGLTPYRLVFVTSGHVTPLPPVVQAQFHSEEVGEV